MPSVAATRRASWRSSIVQHVPKARDDGPASDVCEPAWSYNCIDMPMTSCPARTSKPAATDESTPPDIATTTRMASGAHLRARETSQLVDDRRKFRHDEFDVRVGVTGSETQADGILCPRRGQTHRPKYVRWFERARRAGRPRRNGDSFEIERNQQALGLN